MPPVTAPKAPGGAAAYAACFERGPGRRYPEPSPAHRSEYQRDRDRIVHCAAFRRLVYKTQVFVNQEGDMFRTRLTHSLEVAQIARTAARSLALDEDLTEAICLAHDLGHTPFGHAGQTALNRCMDGYGGFEHNVQALRIVDLLEERYPDFAGLNLAFDTREGILKHCPADQAAAIGPVAARFRDGTQPSVEAQLANVCDEIAYVSHDVDDGLRAGLLGVGELRDVPAFRRPYEDVKRRWPALDERRTIHEVVRRIIGRFAVDLIQTTAARLEEARPASVAAVRARADALALLSPEVAGEVDGLKRFLHVNLYQHYRVHRMAAKAGKVVGELFAALVDDPRLLPPEARGRARAAEARDGAAGRARAVADYIAGMTDRFALREHERLFAPSAFS